MFGYNQVARPASAHKARRSEHNAAKAALIRWACWWCRETGVALHVCDVACGKGQDTNKWAAERGVQSFVGSDAAPLAVAEAHRRALERGCAGWRHVAAPGTAHLATRAAGIVSIQFALHYFCASEASAAALLDDVARALVPGGLFIGTTVREDALPLPADAPTWGAGYLFALPGRIDSAEEYRVPRSAFRALAEARGLRLCFWRPLDAWLRGANMASSHASNACYVVFAFIRDLQHPAVARAAQPPVQLGGHSQHPDDEDGPEHSVGERAAGAVAL